MTAKRLLYSLLDLDDSERLDLHEISLTDLGADIEVLRRLDRYDARVNLKSTATGVMAEFCGEFTAVLPCVRCLEDAVMSFKERLHLEYVAGVDPRIKHVKTELQAKDIDRVYFTGNDIDLAIGLRELVVLALPIAPLCAPSCAGICPVCGRNRNKNACRCQAPVVGRFMPAAPLRRIRRKK